MKITTGQISSSIEAKDYAIPSLYKFIKHAAVLLATFGLIHYSAYAQFAQQESKLVGSGARGASGQGFATSISSDGNTASNLQANSYCTSRGTNTTHGYIKTVSMETINNTSGNNSGYADFTAQKAILFGGATYTIELTPGFNPLAYVEYWTVYIDYNHDGVFEANEIVGEKNAYIRVNKSFTIPKTALNGATRMRIQMQAGAQQTNPCATYTFGEVEDYTVVIRGNSPDIAQTNSDIENVTGDNTVYFRLNPNPAKDNLEAEFTGSSNGGVNMNVYNLSGQKVMSLVYPLVKGLNTLNLNTSKLGAGFYILEIENNGLIQRQKFLISR